MLYPAHVLSITLSIYLHIYDTIKSVLIDKQQFCFLSFTP